MSLRVQSQGVCSVCWKYMSGWFHTNSSQKERWWYDNSDTNNVTRVGWSFFGTLMFWIIYRLHQVLQHIWPCTLAFLGDAYVLVDLVDHMYLICGLYMNGYLQERGIPGHTVTCLPLKYLYAHLCNFSSRKFIVMCIDLCFEGPHH